MSSLPENSALRLDGDGSVLRAAGEIDLSSADQLVAAVVTYDAPGAQVMLDLSAVTFIDSSGLGALVRAAEGLKASGRGLTLRRPSAQLTKLLAITSLLDQFEIEAPTEPNGGGE